MKSTEIIQSFQAQISWADECEIIDLSYLCKDFQVMRHGDFYFIPLMWHKEVLLIDYHLFLRITQAYVKDFICPANKPSFCIIWGGEISQAGIEQITNETQGTGITPFWENAKTSLNFSTWLFRISEGVDWNRTFIEWDPESPKILMEWDK
jgi:hypothetical protein